MFKSACCYVRVSTVANQTTTRQISDLKEYASSLGYIIKDEDVFSENISGFKNGNERPVLRKMLDILRSNENKYAKVFVSEVSRISRNPIEGRKIVDALSELGIPIHVQNNSLCSLNEDGTPNFLFQIVFSVLLEFARAEAEYIKTRSTSGLANKVKNGHAGGGVMLPYGYYRDDKKMLRVDEEESLIIKEIYDYLLRGLGTTQIAHILNERNIVTRTQKAIKKGGIKFRGKTIIKDTGNIRWVDGVIHGILVNPIYKGSRRFKNQLIEAPAIISVETWDKAQQILRSRSNNKIRETRYLYLLKGIIKCGKCGRNYVAKYRPGGKDSFYECSSRRSKCCGNTAIGIDAIESVVWDLLKFTPTIENHIRNSTSDIINTADKLALVKVSLDMEEKELVNLDAEKEQLIKLYQKGHIDDNKLDAEFKKVNRMLQLKEQRILSLRNELTNLYSLKDRLNNRENLLSLIGNIENDRNKIATVIDNLVEKVIVSCVERIGNQFYYLASIFIKDLSTCLSVVIITSSADKKGIFILTDIAKTTGNNRYKYVFAPDYIIVYNNDGVIESDLKLIQTQIMEYVENHVIDINKHQQFNIYGQNLLHIEEAVNGYEKDMILETVPFALSIDKHVLG